MVDSPPKTRTARMRLKALFVLLTGAAALGYLVMLIAAVVILRFTADSWWVAAGAQYLPRFVFLVPLPFLTAALLLLRQKRLLWSQLASLVIVIFPLMGFVLPGPTSRGDGPVMRVLSYNVNSGFSGYAKISDEILTNAPDVILVQEIAGINAPQGFETELLKHYPHVQRDVQFLIASRFPILSKVAPDPVAFEGDEHTARFMAYVVDSPLGKVTFLNVHPKSPRSAFYALRGNAGLRRSLLSGHFFRGPGKDKLMYTLDMLASQLGAVAERARHEQNPVIIAGDLNLPTLSPVFRQHFSEFQDGFERAGWGFGQTFPNRRGVRMWLRLDRILASDQLDFVGFETSCTGSSDHYCVVADLQRR